MVVAAGAEVVAEVGVGVGVVLVLVVVAQALPQWALELVQAPVLAEVEEFR